LSENLAEIKFGKEKDWKNKKHRFSSMRELINYY
jgi:hypothetical protein